MNYIKKKTNHYDIHMIETDKFKKNVVKFYFRSPIQNQSEEIKRDILCNLLVLGTEKYSTKRELEKKCEDLFGANISINNVKSGNYFIFSISLSYLSKKYTKEDLTEEAIAFLKDIIFFPKLVNHSFDEKLVSLAKEMYLEEIESIADSPSSLSVIQMRSYTSKNSNYAYDPYFHINDIKKITASDLYECYQKILAESEFDVMMIGNNLNSKALENLPIHSTEYNQPFYDPVEGVAKENEIVEEKDYNQSKLAISYQIQNLNDFEKKYVMYVFSYILGGSSDSLLFKKIRQEHSLCYYVNSSYLFFYQMLEITAGIQSKNLKETVALVKEAIQEIQDGKFSKEEIEKAQITYQSAWKEIVDSPFSILNMYLSHKYYQLDLMEQRMEQIKKVTMKDVIEISKKIQLSTIYLLKGMNEDEEEATL